MNRRTALKIASVGVMPLALAKRLPPKMPTRSYLLWADDSWCYDGLPCYDLYRVRAASPDEARRKVAARLEADVGGETASIYFEGVDTPFVMVNVSGAGAGAAGQTLWAFSLKDNQKHGYSQDAKLFMPGDLRTEVVAKIAEMFGPDGNLNVYAVGDYYDLTE